MCKKRVVSYDVIYKTEKNIRYRNSIISEV